MRRPHVGSPAAVSGLWEPGRLDAAHGVGFHAASAADAVAIRWSEPAAYVELPLAAGRYVIRLSYLLPPQARRELRVNFYLDERLIPAEDVTIRTDSIELRVDVHEPSSPTRLGWVRSANLVDDADRWLGVPLVSVAWTHADGGTNHVDEPAIDEVELAHPG